MEQQPESAMTTSSTAVEGGGEAMARGLSAMLESVIKDFDSISLDALNSQDKLSASLDRLVQELDQLLENAPLPLIVQQASRITSVKQRVSSLNLVLKSIQRRIDNIDHMLSANPTTTTTTLDKTSSETTTL
ncbi:PREDICTED: uncharacterized protein LOC104714192 [Camelina sativa]|uniref:Biogenesis of lysosome-related organelles complex 1 subunit 7 n=1 Tax=Camelina sativa TaxID=90675 RepID=A0ABM0TQL4_CAMSA|nr:PREDICTED: uncharacterized protein LOC104714192 [Camelina sativa]